MGDQKDWTDPRPGAEAACEAARVAMLAARKARETGTAELARASADAERAWDQAKARRIQAQREVERLIGLAPEAHADALAEARGARVEADTKLHAARTELSDAQDRLRVQARAVEDLRLDGQYRDRRKSKKDETRMHPAGPDVPLEALTPINPEDVEAHTAVDEAVKTRERVRELEASLPGLEQEVRRALADVAAAEAAAASAGRAELDRLEAEEAQDEAPPPVAQAVRRTPGAREKRAAKQ